MFNPAAYENSRPDGHPVLEIVPEEEAPGSEGASRRFVPLRRTELAGEVTGPLASLQLTQVFGYAREQCDRVLEARYRFPLPGDAAVTGVRVRFGDVEILAALKEREKAEEEYEEARRSGRQSALATRESADVFTLQVAGLQPDQEVTIETSYVQLARTEGESWSLRVPLTTSPRYVRRDEEGARQAAGQPLFLLRDPGHRFRMDLAFSGGAEVRSPTHKLEVSEEEGARVRLAEGEVLPDRDCVLQWRLPREARRPGLQVLVHEEPETEEIFFLALVTPPARDGAGSPPPIGRETILLVDHSGSMSGAKWEAADWAVKQFLAGLKEPDRFTLGLFHDRTQWFSRKLVPAGADQRKKAAAFLEEHRDSGGTELGVALEQALNVERAAGELSRHVLVVTDAEVTDAGRILRLAEVESRREDRRRISVLCIDAAPDSFLASELAARGGGVSHFLTSSPDEEDITTALDEILADWSAPVLAGLRLEADRPAIAGAGREVGTGEEPGWSALDLGDLPAGRGLWAAGRLPRGAGRDLSFRLVSKDGKLTACRVPLGGQNVRRPAVKALFGARQVLGLEFLLQSGYSGKELRDQIARLGYDPAEVLAGARATVYGENAQKDVAAALKELLTREALAYGLASSETAFVATRSEAGKPIEGTVAVANALPSGWSDDFLGLPAGGAMVHCFAAAPSQAIHRRKRSGGPAASAAMFDLCAAPPSFLRQAPQAAAPQSASSSRARDAARTGGVVVFAGAPRLTNGEAVLWDPDQSVGDATGFRSPATLTRLVVQFPGSAPAEIDPGLALLLYVGDLSASRARVRLADIVRQGGERPLNTRLRGGEAIRLVLVDPDGAWAGGAPEMEVRLVW